MSQTNALIATLKRLLKSQGKTYADVAIVLELSEASVKRLFAEKNFSLIRLDKLCTYLNMEISDLVKAMEAQSGQITQLTIEQEQELASDLKLLLLASLLLNSWTFEDVIATYQIDQLEGIQMLAKLDRMKLIDLLPGNRVKLKISRNFSWRKNGPIQKFFEQQVQMQFLRSTFSRPGEIRVFLNGMLSRRSNEELQRRIKRLKTEFLALVTEDEALPLEERFGTGCVMAMRPWEPDQFAEIRRTPNRKNF